MPLAEGQKITSPAWEYVKNNARAEAFKLNVTYRWILFQALDEWLQRHISGYQACPLNPSDLLAQPKGRPVSRGTNKEDSPTSL